MMVDIFQEEAEMVNSERFLSAFNRIHEHMRKELGEHHFISFIECLNRLRKKNYVVNRHYDELYVYNDLRNVIVHKKIDANYVIAEPHLETVIGIEAIERELTKPEKVFPKFQSEVKSFQIDETLDVVLTEVSRKGFSQFPVYDDNNFMGLLTENGIANWLAHSVEDDIFSISETSIGDVFAHEESRDNYQFISKNISVYEAKEKFIYHLEKGAVKLDALLITENGKETEKLLGIITPWDIINV